MKKLKSFIESKTGDPIIGGAVGTIIDKLDERWESTFNNELATTSAVFAGEETELEEQEIAASFLQNQGFEILKQLNEVARPLSPLNEVETKLKLAEQFSQFIDKRGPFAAPSEATIEQVYALARFRAPQLTTVAQAVLDIIASEAAAERSFKYQKRIHREDRASLKTENVDTELFIRMNLKYFDDGTGPGLTVSLPKGQEESKEDAATDSMVDDEDIGNSELEDEVDDDRESDEDEPDSEKEESNDRDEDEDEDEELMLRMKCKRMRCCEY